MKRALLILIIIQFSVPLSAQQEELGNWLMYFGTNKVSDNLSIHSEIQYRNHELAPNTIEQLLLRTGVNFHFADNAFATGGYAYVAGHVYESEQSGPESEEHRIFQQLIVNDKVGKVKFEHRYRVEQRWVNLDYRNRLRYRLMLFLPLGKPVIKGNTFFLGVYDEIFVNTEKTYFDRNRLYAALGYQFSKKTSVQVGYLNQAVNNFYKHHLQFALVYNPDLRKTY